MKKMISILLATLTLLSLTPTIAFAADVTAIKATSQVTVDGEIKTFDAYAISGNNYFKLRDIAYAISGTAKQFEVTWDSTKSAINLVSGKKYTPVGGEMAASVDNNQKSAMRTAVKIYLDGKEISPTAYLISGNTYFKLRDLGSLFDFSVEWDDIFETVEIESAFGYIPENSGDSYAYNGNIDIRDTQNNYISNWAHTSPVQQFPYKDEGLAYAYVEENTLNIKTPSLALNIEMKYPLLGDVLSDDDGNFYVVWGMKNETDNAQIETVFISKYSSSGVHIKSTGFVGTSSPWGNDSAKTKLPFEAGNCVSAISNGILVNYHAKQRYDGHQSDNVIAVRTADMSPYTFPNDTYSGHSFNQSVIYSNIAKDFVFASHGDAYARGFRVNRSDGEYGDNDETVFHFYLESNANYNMQIVNKTYAQLGGLAETSKGVVLVGASAKSIGETAKTEKQNLFIQIFNPSFNDLSPSVFVGGTTRSGATSFDINDNESTPLENVTDYGVIWLTNNTDREVVAPQIVIADDRIVILWTEDANYKSESFYIVLSAGGDIMTPKTSLGRMQLNSYERPVYHNELVSWVCTYGGKLRVVSIMP